MELEQEIVTEQHIPATDAPSGAVEKPAPEVVLPDPKDRSGIIKQAFDQVKKGEKPTVKVAQNAAGRPIDPASGKFLPKSLPEKAAQPAAASAPAQAAQAAAAVPQQPAAPVPGSLMAHLKSDFVNLPKQWQEEIRRLDKTGADAGQKFAPQIKAYQELQGVIAPYENLLRATGRTPAQTIAAMMNAEAALLTGTPQAKAQMFRQFMQQYNVPAELVLQGMQPTAQSQDGMQPQIQMPDLSQHPLVQQLTNQVSTLSQHYTQQQQAQQQAQTANAMKSVQDFLAETKQNGTPKFPLDDSLEDSFAAEISMVRNSNPDWDGRRVLEAAYQNLAWKTPQLREVLLKDQEAERQAKLQQELAAKKAAGVQVKGGPASAALPAKVDPKNRRDLIAHNFRTHGRA